MLRVANTDTRGKIRNLEKRTLLVNKRTLQYIYLLEDSEGVSLKVVPLRVFGKQRKSVTLIYVQCLSGIARSR